MQKSKVTDPNLLFQHRFGSSNVPQTWNRAELSRITLLYQKRYPMALKILPQEKGSKIKNVGNKILWKICFMFDFDMNTFCYIKKKKINASIKYVHIVFLKTYVCCFRGPLVILFPILFNKFLHLLTFNFSNHLLHIPDWDFLLWKWTLICESTFYYILFSDSSYCKNANGYDTFFNEISVLLMLFNYCRPVNVWFKKVYKQEIVRNLWFYGIALDLQQSPPS